MEKNESLKGAQKQDSISNSTLNDHERGCKQIVEELNYEYAVKCKSKVNALEKCNTCIIRNQSWPKINSIFDAKLLNTGRDGTGGAILSGAGTDLQWEVGIGDVTGPSSVFSWIPAFVYRNTAWASSSLNNANWISLFRDGKHSDYITLYFRTRFYLNSSINPSLFTLNMSLFADNSIGDIYVNSISQAANYPALLPQEQGSGSDANHYKGFSDSNGIDISLNKDWRKCENEIIVRVHSGPGYAGFLARNTSTCYQADIPQYHPTIEIKWGEREYDCIENNGFESMCLTVCNNYSNIDFKRLNIGKIEICDENGNPVDILPNGEPSVQVIPKGPLCFGDIPSCSCISREFIILNRGTRGGKYKIKVSGICFDVCLNYSTDECFEFEICK